MAQSFDVSGESKSQSLGVTLKAEAKGSPGNIDVSGTVAGKLGLSVGGAFSRATGGSRPTININYRLQAPSKIRSDISRHIRSLKGISGVPSALIPSSSNVIPSQIRNINRDQATLWTGFFGNHLFGTTPISFNKSVSFPPIKIPELPNNRIDINSLPDVTLIVSVTPTGFIQNMGARALNDLPTVKLNIPATAFIEQVNIATTPCAKRFESVYNQIKSFSSDSTSIRSNVSSDLSTLESSINDVSSIAGVSSSIADIRSMSPKQIATDLSTFRSNISSSGVNLSDPSTWKSQTISGDRLSSIKQKIQQADPSSFKSKIQSDINKLNSIISDAEGNKFGECAKGILNRAQSVKSNLEEVLTLINKVSTIRHNLLQIIPSSITSVQKPQLSCADVSRRLTNQVSGFQTSVNGFVGRPVTRRTPSRFASLVQEGKSLMSEVESNVSDKNPCKKQLRNQLETNLQKLQSQGTVRPGEIPCGRRLPNVDSSVSQFENEVLKARNSPSQKNYQRLVHQGQNVIDNIRSNTDGNSDCRKEFTNRVQSAIKSLGPSNRMVNINIRNAVKNSSQAAQLQKAIQNLKHQINSISP